MLHISIQTAQTMKQSIHFRKPLSVLMHTLIVVRGSDLQSCQIGQYGYKGLGVEPGHPLRLLSLIQTEPKGLTLYRRLVIALNKDGRGEFLA